MTYSLWYRYEGEDEKDLRVWIEDATLDQVMTDFFWLKTANGPSPAELQIRWVPTEE